MYSDTTDKFIFGGFILICVALLIAMVFAIRADNRKEAATCAKMWAISRTREDTLKIISDCELKSNDKSPIVIPMPIIIPR